MTKQSAGNPPSLTAYDEMDTHRLEQLLQEDLQGGGAPLDEQTLIYITGLLAQRKPAPGAGTAWQTFQSHYLTRPGWLRYEDHRLLWQRLTAAAAALALLLSLPVASLAIASSTPEGYRASWDLHSFQFQWKKHAIPDPTRWTLNGASVKELQDAGLYPNWLPFGFQQYQSSCGITGRIECYAETYRNGDRFFTVSLFEVTSRNVRTWEVDGETVQLYPYDGINFYLYRNGQRSGACWVKEGLECSIVGDLSEEQIKKMIHSMRQK